MDTHRCPYTCTKCGCRSKRPRLCSRCGKNDYYRKEPHPCRQCGRIMHSNGTRCYRCAGYKTGRRRHCEGCGQSWVERGQGAFCANCRWHLRHSWRINRGSESRLVPVEFKKLIEARIRLYHKRAMKGKDLFADIKDTA